MTLSSEALMPVTGQPFNNKQRLFVRYFTGILIDLLVLNLFVEYSDKVVIDSFSISLLAAVLLQVLLKATIAVEHWVSGFFKGKRGGVNTFLRFFFAWLVLFGSKFVILEAISLAFGDKVQFLGRFHGIVTLIVVIVTMLVAEEAIVRLYRALGEKPAAARLPGGDVADER
ncbi:hypothetical protein [Luteimonas sp. A482]